MNFRYLSADLPAAPCDIPIDIIGPEREKYWAGRHLGSRGPAVRVSFFSCSHLATQAYAS